MREIYQEVIALYREMSHFETTFDSRTDANHELSRLLDYQIQNYIDDSSDFEAFESLYLYNYYNIISFETMFFKMNR